MRRRLFFDLIAAAALMTLAAWMLRRSLFSGGTLLPCWPNTDMFLVYLPWRTFGFAQWKAGHFPFWNPRVFCGIPFFAQIQSALLYPVGWINFFLRTTSAVVWEMAINLGIAAICTYAWARQRGLSRGAGLLAGALFAFSAPLYHHLIVGYMTILSSSAWIPLIFLACDLLLREQYFSGILIGSLAICLQCLGGHAQLVYYTLLISGLYVLLHAPGSGKSMRIYLVFASMCALGILLASIQLLPTYFATRLSVRAGGASYEFASALSLPPENLLTLLVPYPMGDMVNLRYFGRWYLWESSIYTGIVALALACIGLAKLPKPRRWRMSIVLAVILVLCLGSYTPIYRLLYYHLPGFNLFRSTSKFGLLWTLLIAMLAGHGWDAVRSGHISRWIAWLIGIAATICIAAAIVTTQMHLGARLIELVRTSGQFFLTRAYFFDPQSAVDLTKWMVGQWCIAAALLAGMALLVYLRRYSIMPAYLLLALAVIELCAASSEVTPTEPATTALSPEWTGAISNSIARDERLAFASEYNNYGEEAGYNSIWGYDTGQPSEYTRLLAESQGEQIAAPDQYHFIMRQLSPIFRLLRCGYVLGWKQDVMKISAPMPHAELIGSYEKMNDAAAIRAKLLKGDFDFTHLVILETDPAIQPTARGTSGHVQLLNQSINDLEISADLDAPALLLITDAYAPGWKAQAMESNPSQKTYEVLPADDVLRIIPLEKGRHHIRVYYQAPGWLMGIVISGIAAVIYSGLLIAYVLWKKRHDRKTDLTIAT
ncbi:MAG TPA: hypothetical protein VGG19_09595 [Tepidisphaeraceae bacterium]|jgi:hypothetical protein